MREIIFDTETTGLSPENGDRIVEFGAIELINRVETGRVYHAYYNPERPMDAVAQAIHGLSDAFLSDKPVFRDTVEDLLDFIEDSPLVAHNAMFDLNFLNHEFALCGRFKLQQSRIVDTLAIAKVRHPGAKHSLDALCVRYGVDRSHRVKHGALLDAQLLAQIYIEMLGGRQIGFSLSEPQAAPTEPFLEADDTQSASVMRVVRPHRASPEELARHKAFIENIDNALWLNEV